MSTPHDAGTDRTSLILTRTDIAALMRPVDWLASAEAAFRALGEGRVDLPHPLAVHGSDGVFHAKAAGLRGDRHYVALKLNANFPGNPQRSGLPTIQGAILLCDGETGAVLAVMDSIEVTLRRTAAATALAARLLARPESTNILICGCGAQAPAQLEALRDVLPLARCLAWDSDHDQASRFTEAARIRGFAAEVANDLATAGLASDVIVTCSTARQPFLDRHMVRDGSFVAAVGADSPEKSEITPQLLASGKVVADVLDQCAAMGDLHHAIAAKAVQREAVHGELAELVCGTKRGRTSADEIIIFDSTGTGLQDVAAAAAIYERATADGHSRRVALAG